MRPFKLRTIVDERLAGDDGRGVFWPAGVLAAAHEEWLAGGEVGAVAGGVVGWRAGGQEAGGGGAAAAGSGEAVGGRAAVADLGAAVGLAGGQRPVCRK